MEDPEPIYGTYLYGDSRIPCTNVRKDILIELSDDYIVLFTGTNHGSGVFAKDPEEPLTKIYYLNISGIELMGEGPFDLPGRIEINFSYTLTGQKKYLDKIALGIEFDENYLKIYQDLLHRTYLAKEARQVSTHPTGPWKYRPESVDYIDDWQNPYD